MPTVSSPFYLILTRPHQTFPVISFSCQNDALSKHYTFDINLHHNKPLDHTLVDGSPAKLIIGKKSIHGYLTDFVGPTNISQDKKYFSYSLTLESPLHALSLKKNNRIFIEKSIVDIISILLIEHQWETSNFHFKIKNKTPPISMIRQHEETDLYFIQRLLQTYGIFFYFRQRNSENQIIFSDNLSPLHKNNEKLTLKFIPNIDNNMSENQIWEWKITEQVLTKNIMLRNVSQITSQTNNIL